VEQSSPIGVILVGGRSTRMGTDKSLVDFRGRPMYQWVANALEDAGCEVVIAGREQLGALPGYPDAPDAPMGPLGGLLTVASLAGERAMVLAATDQPLLRSETVTALLALSGPVVVPIDEGIAQVTCAVYRQTEIGQPLIATAHSIQDLVTQLPTRRVGEPEWRAWDEDGRSWFSVDTPAALTRAAQWSRDV